MFRSFGRLFASLSLLTLAPLDQASAVGFQFHCRGNACGAVSFLDEGNGCTVVTNRSRSLVHITQGVGLEDYVLGPGETRAPLLGPRCVGYYDGGETATFAAPAR